MENNGYLRGVNVLQNGLHVADMDRPELFPLLECDEFHRADAKIGTFSRRAADGSEDVVV